MYDVNMLIKQTIFLIMIFSYDMREALSKKLIIFSDQSSL